MDIVPEWAPSIHPMLVHFPIALLFTAALLDLAALLARKQDSLRVAAVVVYVLGGLGTLASYFTGKNAADAVLLSGPANTVLTDHADWATLTVWFFGLYALLRLGVWWWDQEGKKTIVWIPLWLLGVGGLFLVYQTGEHGAQMVFEHGVGVKAMAELEAQARQQQAELDRSRAIAAGPQAEDNGSWRWTPGEQAAASLVEAFTWLEGDTTALAPQARPQPDGSTALALQASGPPVFFVFDQALSSIQADLALHLDDFDGSVQVVHHVQDARNYLFTEIAAGMMRQGRVEEGAVSLMDEKPFAGQGWQQMRVVADQTHFRAYAEGALVTHGHGPAPEPGPVGLRIEGTGTVLLGPLSVESLR